MLKKTTLAVMGLTASGFIFAGTMGPVCTPGNVTVACEARHWSLGLQGLYLNIAEGANRSYRLAAAAPAVIPLNNQWDWGYKAEGSFQFNTGNDVIVNWTHFNSTLRQGGFATPFSVEAIVPYGLNNQSRFDQVNVAMGQSVDFSVTNKMRVYGGLQYANIQENDTNIFPAPLPFRTAPNLGGTYYDNTNYKGVGPVIGVDYAYDLTNGISLIANGSTSLLYGTSRISSGYVLAPTNLVVGSTYGSKKTITPSFEAKLGVNYGYAMPQGVVNLEGGYQVINYFNVLQASSLQIAPATSSNFSLYGPYVGLKYVGNA